MICPVCQTKEWRHQRLTQSCRECGFVRAEERFFKCKHQEIYTDLYYSKGDYASYAQEKPALEKNFAKRLKTIKKYVPGGFMLEIGSAQGYFVHLAKKDYQIEGVECNSKIASSVQKREHVHVYHGQFEDLKLKQSSYDVIVALDTIEHVRFPDKFIKNCFHTLKSGGYLFLETGDINRLLPRIQKQNWRLIKPPEHLNYFSADSLKRILKQSGFVVVKVEYVVFWRTIAQTIFRLNPKLFAKLPLSIQDQLYRFCFPLYTGDIMFIVAQKQ